ncbi:DUF4349 domain-containing protein [Actinomadura madurae]|uniref:DUF4349 domain-containing protein n=2 Tax=Actinomadura TaxID=1988 RepID=UPI0020D23FC9|nr:DUF4349 domain-containing protein [Actinomadura madurae]MCP9978300.1 DUF4349 domain-containing protein [Actinomadura madurae]MCQ0010181.1 DUF4349 domain-containing protein [Actinomadura madurae]
MRIVRNITCALVVLLLAGVLAGCSGGGDDSSGASSEAVDRGGARAPAATSGAGRQQSGEAGGGPGSGSGSGSRAAPPLPSGREVVHSAQLRVRAGDVESAATKAKQMVTTAGGYVEQESTSSDPARSEIALKIPTDRYTDVLNQLSTQLGTKLSLSQQAEDVTGEVADVEARVRSAKATLESFRKLLDRANSVSEIINIEEEIAERESDLESLQARHKSLTHRTAFATVTVTLVTKPAPPEKKEEPRGGFIGGLENGWGAFTAFVGGLATVLGWLLPFLVTAAVLGIPVLAFRHRLRDRFSGWGSAARPPRHRNPRRPPSAPAKGRGRSARRGLPDRRRPPDARTRPRGLSPAARPRRSPRGRGPRGGPARPGPWTAGRRGPG